MLPILQGMIARRVLLNFRADPAAVQKLLPQPFIAESYQGFAMVGVCLIRLEQLRPRGFPAPLGLASENVAHRVAVLYPANGTTQRGVFILRRETDQRLVQMFGGRLFPGVHHEAKFRVRDDDNGLHMEVNGSDGESEISFSAGHAAEWPRTSVFAGLREASDFYRHGDCGFSCTRTGGVEGMRLKTLEWSPKPLKIDLRKASFLFNSGRSPYDTVDFDCGLIMRRVPHEWHEIKEPPEAARYPGFPFGSAA